MIFAIFTEHKKAKTNTEFLIQKVLSAFAFALENAATENYYRYYSMLICLT